MDLFADGLELDSFVSDLVVLFGCGAAAAAAAMFGIAGEESPPCSGGTLVSPSFDIIILLIFPMQKVNKGVGYMLE